MPLSAEGSGTVFHDPSSDIRHDFCICALDFALVGVVLQSKPEGLSVLEQSRQ
jgi:hypothetical protein